MKPIDAPSPSQHLSSYCAIQISNARSTDIEELDDSSNAPAGFAVSLKRAANIVLPWVKNCCVTALLIGVLKGVLVFSAFIKNYTINGINNVSS